jgi:phosphoglycolate phosphatase
MWFFFKRKVQHPQKKFILFDFDGTLALTIDYILDIVNRNRDKFKTPLVSRKDFNALRDMPPMDILKRYGISLPKLAYMSVVVRMELNQHIADIQVVPGIPKLLGRLRQEKYKMGIMTSNSEVNVKKFLKKNGLLKYFSVFHSGIGMFGKTGVINSFLKKTGLSPGDVVYIGDEIRDIESSRKSKVEVVAVGWGFNSKKALLAHKPDHFIQSPMQLLKVLKGKKVISRLPRFQGLFKRKR